MFPLVKDGYNRDEVDKYISNLKSELMQYKLSLLESEKKVLDLKEKTAEVNAKEQSIMKAVKAIEKAQKMQEGSNNLFNLRKEQIGLICDKVHELMDFLRERHPEIRADRDAVLRLNEVDDIVKNAKDASAKNPINSENDSMRALLNKMQEYRRREGVKTVKVQRNDIPILREENVDEFLSKEPENKQLYKNIDVESNGFNLEEAINPKDDLSEIMKAFDFFNNDD